MKSPYKSFIAYTHGQNMRTLVEMNSMTDNDPEFAKAHMHRDPMGGQWRNNGLAFVEGEQACVELGSMAWLMHIQINERILPAKVRDEAVKLAVAKFREREDRPVGKKQYAELREEVEAELLPKAFIKRTVIPVMFVDPDYLFIFTSSATKADTVIAILIPAMNEVCTSFTCQRLFPKGNILKALTTLLDDSSTSEHAFEIGDSGTLKGTDDDDPKTVKVKDLDLASHDVSCLMKDEEYQIHDIAIRLFDGMEANADEALLDFKLNEKFVFRNCEVPDVKMQSVSRDDQAAELLSFSFLTAKSYRTALEAMIEYMGGRRVSGQGDDEMPPPDDEEEKL